MTVDTDAPPPSPDDQASVTVRRGEIFIGLVGALGTDLDVVEEQFKRSLLRVSYQTQSVRVSDLIDDAFAEGQMDLPHPAQTTIDDLMDKGDALRERAEHGSITAALAISAISDARHATLADEGAREREAAATVIRQLKHPDEDVVEREAAATVIRQLKHPDEVEALRSTYGPRFVLVGAWAPEPERRRIVRARLEHYHPGNQEHWYDNHVTRLLKRDEKDGLRPLGQRVRDTFELADAFVALLPGRPVDSTIDRFVDLLFGKPFETPTSAEQAMYQAAGARLRSSASGRQVGAVVVDAEGEVLVAGTNDAPKPGGGQYWTGDQPDHRDFQYGYEYNDRQKLAILTDILRRLQAEPSWLAPELRKTEPQQLAASTIAEAGPLHDSRIGDLLEFGRILHAEMAAICTAARRGTALAGFTMYSTTYPCHQCARLIIGSGISRLVYVDPYPKSLVPDMYRDEVVDGPSSDDSKVVFEPFQGVAPRLYRAVFTMAGRTRDSMGQFEPWRPELAQPRLLAQAEVVYPIQSMEDQATKQLEEVLDQRTSSD